MVVDVVVVAIVDAPDDSVGGSGGGGTMFGRVAVAVGRGVDLDAVDADRHPEGEVAGAEQAVTEVLVEPGPLRRRSGWPGCRRTAAPPDTAGGGCVGGAVVAGGAAVSPWPLPRSRRRPGRAVGAGAAVGVARVGAVVVVGVAASGREAAHAAAPVVTSRAATTDT